MRARSGNDLDPGDRLHLCGSAVPPATGRIAGHRRAFLGPGRRRVRTEVAVYADGGAARALDALRALAPRCSQPVPPGSVELPSVLALHVALVRTAADPEPREVVVLRSGDALAVLEVDGAGPARTIELARLVAARLDREQPAPAPVSSSGGHERRTEVVHQRRGGVLSVLTVEPVDGRDDPLVRQTAALLGGRLDRQVGASIG